MTIDEKVIPWIIAGAGVILAALTWWRTRKKDVQQDAGANAGLRMDINYIKRGVDDIRIDQKCMREDVGKLSERVVRVEESCKSAHHRLDGLEKGRKE